MAGRGDFKEKCSSQSGIGILGLWLTVFGGKVLGAAAWLEEVHHWSRL